MLGIVNGTTNFVLGEMEAGRGYADALAEAQRLGYAEADPTEDVTGLDAAAKMAILATVAFGTRVPLDWIEVSGIDTVRDEHVAAARALDMRVKLVGEAVLVGERVGVRVRPAFVDAHHPLAAVEGAFNAVMLHGDAIREITLEGPGAGGPRDRLGRRRRHGVGARDERRRLPERGSRPALARAAARRASSRLRTTSGSRSRTARACSRRLAQELANEGVSVARLVQQPGDGHAVLHVVTHEAPAGKVQAALDVDPRASRVARRRAAALPVVSSRGVEELGWT